MKRFLPKNFSFSWWTTGISILLALGMFRLSAWQWQRYHYKVALLQRYEDQSVTLPQGLVNGLSKEEFSKLLHKKVALTGVYDFEHQVLIANRRHASGPGYWLLTPLKLSGSDKYAIISRGFVPFADDNRELLRKYDLAAGETTVNAIVQETVPHRSFLYPDSVVPGSTATTLKWLYPDIEQIASKLPYPVISSVFFQRLGKSSNGTFPAESITVDVPPSTHFGYTIEWILLGLATLAGGFLLQAFPPRLWRIDSAPLNEAARHTNLNGARFNGTHLPQPERNKDH